VNIYIDCEWNDWGGELISMALCSEDGQEFYEVIECKHPTEWVALNVIPVLNKEPINKILLKAKLKTYLNQFETINIVADWPEDIERFCNMLIVGPGCRMDTPALTMQIIRVDADSDIPHNALEDARGLKVINYKQ